MKKNGIKITMYSDDDSDNDSLVRIEKKDIVLLIVKCVQMIVRMT